MEHFISRIRKAAFHNRIELCSTSQPIKFFSKNSQLRKSHPEGAFCIPIHLLANVTFHQKRHTELVIVIIYIFVNKVKT